MGIGLSDLAPLLNGQNPMLPKDPHFAPKAKRVIHLFMNGGPSHVDTFDPKPELTKWHGKILPDENRLSTERKTGAAYKSPFTFKKHGQSGLPVSDLFPQIGSCVDDIAIVRSMSGNQVAHGGASLLLHTGDGVMIRPSMGAWLSYGLGSMNENLPSFVTLVTKNKGGQPLVSRLWGSGFLPSRYQGVRFRSGKDPVLYLNNPEGISEATRRRMLDTLGRLNTEALEASHDPLIETQLAQYELAYRMQQSIPRVADMSDEPEHTFEQYGEEARNPGTFAANCLLARRLAERGVRFIQLYHPGWDQHGNLAGGLKKQCQETDQASAALVRDLKQRGMLEDTLVVWGGEFGRTNYCQGKLTAQNFGRDHHPRCFSMWMAGGGVKGGFTYGETDPYGYNVIENPVPVHDLQATMLHCLGIDHERLTFKHQGRRYRLTDVHGIVHHDLLT